MKKTYALVSALLLSLSLVATGCGGSTKDPFADFDVPGYQAAPESIYDTQADNSALEGTAMYADATVGDSGTVSDMESINFTTEQGEISLMDSALNSNWSELEKGQKVRVYFFYIGTGATTQTPAGMFVYAIDPANVPNEPPEVLSFMLDALQNYESATPTPTAEPTPAPTPTVIEGKGDKILEDINLNGNLSTLHFVTSSSRHTAVKFHPASGGSYDLLVNTTEPYDGYTLLSSAGRLEITCSGNWSVEITPLGTTEETSFSGKGDFVTPLLVAPGDSWKIKNTGESNFIVKQIGSTGTDLLVNEIGSYEGEVISDISAGESCLFVITSSGEWSIEPIS